MDNLESLDEQSPQPVSYPGASLAQEREAKGLSQEYIAGKLYLRTRVIELLEADRYDDLPQPVFVQGYLRAYAKLLGLSPEPFLEQFSQWKEPEKKVARILRQKQKEPLYLIPKAKWVVGVAGVVMMIMLFDWWGHRETALPAVAPTQLSQVTESAKQEEKSPAPSSLIDLSTMESNLSLTSNLSIPEPHHD